MTAWGALLLMVAMWLLPAGYHLGRYLARRWRMSLIISLLFLALIPLTADSMGFLPRHFGAVVAACSFVLGVLVDIVVALDILAARKRALSGPLGDEEPTHGGAHAP